MFNSSRYKYNILYTPNIQTTNNCLIIYKCILCYIEYAIYKLTINVKIVKQ